MFIELVEQGCAMCWLIVMCHIVLVVIILVGLIMFGLMLGMLDLMII